MRGESENPGVVRPRLAAIARIVVLGIPLVGTGCIVLPVPSVTPCQQTGIIDDTTLESLAGLDQEGVRERLGWPDYSGPRGRSHLMVYEGAKHYSTDVFFAVAAGYTAAGGTIDGDCGTSKVLYCYVLELDENRIVEDHDVIARSPGAITKRDSSDNTLDAIENCSEAVWKPHQRHEVVTKQEAESEAKASELEAQVREDEVQAREGRSESTIELAEFSGNVTPLQAPAESGDATAAYALYEQLSRDSRATADAWKWLCKSANESHGKAQSEVGYWQRTSVWQLSGDDRISSMRDIGIEPDNRVAYMWYTLADSNGESSALASREFVEADMTPEEITQAEQMVRDWKLGDCPSAEHRFGLPSGT